jgi:hypothetical protein
MNPWWVVAIGVFILIFIIGLCAFDGRERRPPTPRVVRDRTLGKDHYVGERQDRLRKLQAQQDRAYRERRASIRRWL